MYRQVYYLTGSLRSIRGDGMRILVIGTSGAGKTTLARTIAQRLPLSHIELDALNWQPGWRDLVRSDPAEFTRGVAAAIERDGWVADGNYAVVRNLLWRNASHLVWLDYSRAVIMRRVIGRSLLRVALRTELWEGTGNRERWHSLLQPSHPILWAWRTWAALRQETEALIERTEYAHLNVLRLRRPGQARPAVETLTAAGAGR
jgi:adenylate kinase family enzyme